MQSMVRSRDGSSVKKKVMRHEKNLIQPTLVEVFYLASDPAGNPDVNTTPPSPAGVYLVVVPRTDRCHRNDNQELGPTREKGKS